MRSCWLADDAFRNVVTHAPLVSIDLIVRDAESGLVLLGRRKNRPAAGIWFVPGGRIRKNESFEEAFLRLTEEELGQRTDLAASRLHGVYEHFYADSIFGDSVSTHYVVVARMLNVDSTSLTLPQGQHDEYRWMAVPELMGDQEVHPYTQAYFQAGQRDTALDEPVS